MKNEKKDSFETPTASKQISKISEMASTSREALALMKKHKSFNAIPKFSEELEFLIEPNMPIEPDIPSDDGMLYMIHVNTNLNIDVNKLFQKMRQEKNNKLLNKIGNLANETSYEIREYEVEGKVCFRFKYVGSQEEK